MRLAPLPFLPSPSFGLFSASQIQNPGEIERQSFPTPLSSPNINPLLIQHHRFPPFAHPTIEDLPGPPFTCVCLSRFILIYNSPLTPHPTALSFFSSSSSSFSPLRTPRHLTFKTVWNLDGPFFLRKRRKKKIKKKKPPQSLRKPPLLTYTRLF